MSEVSVVILFGKGRSIDALERAVASVGCQTSPPFETLVVLNGATQPPLDASAIVSKACRFVAAPDDVGCAAGRNIGARAALGSILLFVDDDGELGPRAVETVEVAFDEHPEVAAFAGRVLRPEARGSEDMQQGSVDGSVLRFSGGCFSIRRDVFVDEGGYWDDPLALGTPSATRGEEYHLAIKLFRRRQRVALLPGLVLYHPARPHEAAELRVASTAGLARTFFESYPLPAAIVGVAYKVVRDSVLLAARREARTACRIPRRLMPEIRIGLRRRDAMSWSEFRRVRQLDRAAPPVVGPSKRFEPNPAS